MISSRFVTADVEFNELKPAWDELFHSNPNHTPYQSWEWNITWWKHFGTPGRLRLVLVEDDGCLIGIAPLYLAKRLHGVPLAHLAFISLKRSDYLDVLVRPGVEEIFIRALLAFLRDMPHGWLWIEFKDLSDNSPTFSTLRSEVARADLRLTQVAGEVCVTLPLQPNYEAFLAGLSKHFRKDIAYYRRAFSKQFVAEFRRVTSPPEIFGAYEDLIRVYRARWQKKAGATQFDEERTARFERELCERLSGVGAYQIYLLYADQKPAAGILAYRNGNKCYAELFAHSPEFHRHSAGTVLLSMAIEDAIASGCTEFDLMRGDEPYKFRWNARRKNNYHIKIFRGDGILRVVSVIEWVYRRCVASPTLQRSLAQFRRWKLGRAR